jgi:N-acyl-D-amino-acid deacylase
VTCDRYPYIASSTDLDAVLPAWAFEGGNKKEMERLKKGRRELEIAVLDEHPDTAIWDKVVISSVVSEKNKWMEGKSILSVSDVLNKKETDCLFDVLIEENLSVGAIFFTMNEDNLIRILRQPYTMIGSDSTARSFDGITAIGKPHPRGFGSFPRILGKYVREQKVLTVSEAVYKMTGLPARTFRLKERGVIAEGFFADITVFDPEKVNDTAGFDDPFKRPEGIYGVFVNGKPVVLEGEITGAMPGMVLR